MKNYNLHDKYVDLKDDLISFVGQYNNSSGNRLIGRHKSHIHNALKKPTIENLVKLYNQIKDAEKRGKNER